MPVAFIFHKHLTDTRATKVYFHDFKGFSSLNGDSSTGSKYIILSQNIEIALRQNRVIFNSAIR
ncbi:MAG: hypothetical protein ACI8Q6_003948 [Granulosicoccus sp.]|jgi:hypothetical protein